MSEREGKIAGAASVVASATLLSRIFGYIRDMVIAYFLGAGFGADAFFVAFRLSNLLRRLVGEGALTPSFVPVLTDVLKDGDKEAGSRLASNVFTVFLVILFVLALLGVFFSEQLVWLISGGFMDEPEKFDLTVKLTRLMFPYMVFIGLVAVAMGVLNTLRHFAVPAFSPVLFNITIIAATVIIAPFLDVPAYAIVIGVLFGGLLQLLIHLPTLKRYGIILKPRIDLKDPGLRKIFTLLGPAAIGVGVYQLNIFVTLRFASGLGEGSVSYLYYATRLMELPLGVFAVALSTAILPSLASDVVNKDWDSFKGSLGFALRMANFVTIPATVGLLLLSRPIIEVLFMRGEFTEVAASGTSYALYFYAVGLVPVAASRILVSVFYSLKDTKTPVKVAFVSFVANIILCLLLMGPLKHGGLALATSISATVNLAGLLIALRGRVGGLELSAITGSAIKSLVATAVMAGGVLLAIHYVDFATLGPLARVGFLLGTVIGSIILYIAVSALLGANEIKSVRSIISAKMGSKGE